MKAIVKLDYSHLEKGGPISIESIEIFDSKEDNVTQRYDFSWAYGYEYHDEDDLKKAINLNCKTKIKFLKIE